MRTRISPQRFFEANKGDEGGQSTPTTPAPEKEQETQNAQPGGEQGEGFQPITSEAELAAWKESVRKSITTEVKEQLRQTRAQQEAEAERERVRKEQEAKGQYEEVRKGLEQERDTFKGERDELIPKVEAYERLAKIRVEQLRAGLPEAAMDDFPQDQEPIRQLEWLEDRERLLKKLDKLAPPDGQGRRVVATPNADGRLPEISKEQQEAVDRSYRRF